MFRNDDYILLSDNRIARICAPYDGIPGLYIVCYINWGGSIGYVKEASLLKGKKITRAEWKKYNRERG